MLHELLSNESQVALETELHCIQCPIQVVWGREDEVCILLHHIYSIGNNWILIIFFLLVLGEIFNHDY